MREITDHKTNECNEAIKIHADEPSAEYGNSSHLYPIEWQNADREIDLVVVRFQKGPIKEVGVNGVTNEALLAILIDRMRGFQSGAFACQENALALEHLEAALGALLARTKARVTRGVEGTNVA